MHKDEIKGAAKDMSGSMKEAAGKATGDRDMEARGIAEKTEGKVQKGVGNIKDAARNALKN
ncbi:CsbD family protein [Phenylobacterium sp.]|uniref:CsbD family protein n=1 Tax=Phenylobacterium sp. TaxID=1871053 RepID=UPI002DE40674|nr:CsbD family protein [Phenylobacterium sp.]